MLLCNYGTTEALIKLPANMTIPAVFAYGDSIVDQGNNNNLRTVIKCNFPPYGKDFTGSVPTGRFSNAKTPPDLIGKILIIYTFYIIFMILIKIYTNIIYYY